MVQQGIVAGAALGEGGGGVTIYLYSYCGLGELAFETFITVCPYGW